MVATSEKSAGTVLLMQDVSKTFGSFTAVNKVNLSVRQGEIFGFLGPNGAGKSTTIRLLLDILRADSGNITLLGKPSRQVARVHSDIGFLSGDMTLDTDLTGRQYLEFINQVHGGKYAGRITELAARLEANLDKKLGDYSRGNRQKIGLIASLLHNPKLLILDEPSSGFDPLIQERFADLIREYADGGGSVFMSSHVLAEVQHLCDRVAFIRDGRIITTRSIGDLLGSGAKRVEIRGTSESIRKALKGAAEIHGLTMASNEDNHLVFTYTGSPKPLLTYLSAQTLEDIVIREPELEEIFGQYYEESEAADA